MKFSIITVCRNDRAGLEKTIGSVLSQTYRDFEYIIIDGGSTDGSKDLVEQHASSLAFWVSEPDGGIYDAMNKGISAASGDYCLFLNAGDSFASEDVLEIAGEMVKADYACGGAMLDGTQKWTAPQMVDEAFVLNRFSICHQSTFIKTSLLKERPYDTSLRIAADFEHMAYDIVVGKASYEALDLCVCNFGRDGISSDDSASDKEKIRVIDDFRAKGWLREDEAVRLVKKMKPTGRRYRIALKILKMLSK